MCDFDSVAYRLIRAQDAWSRLEMRMLVILGYQIFVDRERNQLTKRKDIGRKRLPKPCSPILPERAGLHPRWSGPRPGYI